MINPYQAEEKARDLPFEVKSISDPLRLSVLDALKRLESRITAVRGIMHGDDALHLPDAAAALREVQAEAGRIQKMAERYIAHSREMSAGHARRRYLDRLFSEMEDERQERQLASGEVIFAETRQILIYLQIKGATRTEIRKQVFYSVRPEAEIEAWLGELRVQGLAHCVKETASNGDVIEKWFATEGVNEND